MQLLNDAKNFKYLENPKKIKLLSFLIALSSILSIIDYLIPKPLPILKLGLANIVSVILISESIFFVSFITGILRVFFSSLIIGNLFSIGFYLSLAGSVFSLSSSIISKYLFKDNIGEVGISVIGASFNMIGQIFTLIIIFNYNINILYYLNLFYLISIILGFLIGIISIKIKEENKLLE